MTELDADRAADGSAVGAATGPITQISGGVLSSGGALSQPPGPNPVPFFVAVRADMSELAKTKGNSTASRSGRIDVLTLPGFWATFLWRLANLMHARGLRPVSRLLYFANMTFFGADLPAGATVGPGLVMPHPVGTAVASDIVLGARVRLMGGVRLGGSGDPKRLGHPVIGDDVWIMDGAKVFGPVSIGERSVIGTSAIVSTNVPADMFVHGPRSSSAFRPLAEMDLADHGGALSPESRPPGHNDDRRGTQ